MPEQSPDNKMLDATPNTLGYMLAGYAALFGLPFLYIVSWLVRARNLHRDLETNQALDEEKEG